MKPIAILGAGSWGTALAVHLSRNEQIVHLWGHDPDKIAAMRLTKTNERYLPDISFPDSLHLFDDLTKAIENVSDILLVVPSFAFRSTLQLLKPLIQENVRIVWATKGIDHQSNQLFDKVSEEILGKRTLAVFSGPSFAKEVALGLPTAVLIASKDTVFLNDLVDRFNRQALRVYTSDDLTGAQLGGAIKNVIAIAVGISDGLEYGANARSAIITRGLAEMTKLGLAMGANPNTFTGLSGIGDLILSCLDDQSRNRRLGLLLGQGLNLEEAKRRIDQVIEGIHTASQVKYLSDIHQVDMPICQQVYRILSEETSPNEIVSMLLSRSPKAEKIL